MNTYLHFILTLMTKKLSFLFLLLTFLLVSCGNSGEYKIVNGKVVWSVYTFSFGEMIDTVEGADTATFEPLKYCYGKDKYHVFAKHRLIKGADINTFEPIDKKLSRDNHDYYWCGLPLNVYDMETFEVFYATSETASWAKDSRYAYRLDYDSIPPRFPHADYKSFEPADYYTSDLKIMSDSYAKDKYNAYFHDKIVKGADLKTFCQVAYNTAQDKNGVYYRERKTQIKDYSVIRRITHDSFTDEVYLYDKELNRIGPLPDSLKVTQNTKTK